MGDINVAKCHFCEKAACYFTQGGELACKVHRSSMQISILDADKNGNAYHDKYFCMCDDCIVNGLLESLKKEQNKT